MLLIYLFNLLSDCFFGFWRECHLMFCRFAQLWAKPHWKSLCPLWCCLLAPHYQNSGWWLHNMRTTSDPQLRLLPKSADQWRSNIWIFSSKYLNIFIQISVCQCQWVSDTVGATPFVDSGWPHLLKWAQKLQSGWLTHIVDQQTCWCVWRYTIVQFVVSLVLDVTICWFGSIIETTFCTADPFCWQHGVRLSPFVDSALSSNQHYVWWTHFVDTTKIVIFQYTERKNGHGQ